MSRTEWGEPYESTVVQYENQPPEWLRGDWMYLGFGPRWIEQPQRLATGASAENMERGWNRLIDKARRDIETITEETRLADYVASHQPSGETVAALIDLIRSRERWQRPQQH